MTAVCDRPTCRHQAGTHSADGARRCLIEACGCAGLLDTSKDAMPPSPIGGMAASAVEVHEIFMSYVAAGFARHEALAMVIGIMQATIATQGRDS